MNANLKHGELLLVITTESNLHNANKVAKTLVANNLAACVSFEEINSIYRWNNEIIQESEVQISIKVRPDLVDKLYDALKEIHSYKLPQFICLNTSISYEYSKWFRENL